MLLTSILSQRFAANSLSKYHLSVCVCLALLNDDRDLDEQLRDEHVSCFFKGITVVFNINIVRIFVA